MAKRANLLADRIEEGSKVLATLVESLTEEEWQTLVPGKERTALVDVCSRKVVGCR